MSKSNNKSKTKSKKIKIEKGKCAPGRNDKLSCYTREQLVKIAEAYNKKYCKGKSKKVNCIKIKGKSKSKLWNEIGKHLSNECESEICWRDQDFVKMLNDHEIKYETFRPNMPSTWKNSGYIEWLSTTDINQVMKQYEKEYPEFLFIGPLPRDCYIRSPLRCQLTSFDINKAYKSGVKCIGIIINTDTSNGPGQHWEAIFVDLRPKKKDITFYDSYAGEPYEETKLLMKRLRDDFERGNNIVLKIDKNNVRHQYDDYNCGMYSMNFIINRLKGKTTRQIDRMKLNTKRMQKMKHEVYIET